MAARGIHVLALAALVASFAALAAPAPAAPATGRTHVAHVALTSLETGVIADLNKIRAQHGLVPLKLNVHLTAAASQHSKEMGSEGYFEHTSGDGTAFWKRIGKWYPQSSFGFWSVGENLLWASPDVDPDNALQLWMASPEHRANILTAKWREIGISAVHVADAPGTYHDQPVTIITTDFGVRH